MYVSINRKSISPASTELNKRQIFTEHYFEEVPMYYPVQAPKSTWVSEAVGYKRQELWHSES